MDMSGLHTRLALPLQQHPLFGRALDRLGRQVATVPLPGDTLVQLVLRHLPLLGPVGLVSQGPVWGAALPASDRTQGYATLRAHGARVLTPDTDDGSALRAAGFRQIITPVTVARLDLTGGQSARRARMHGKWRNRLVAAENAGLTITHHPFAGAWAAWICDLETKQRKSRRYTALPLSLCTALAACAPSALRIFVAHHAGDPVAAMIFVRHGSVATYHIGWTGNIGRTTNAHNMILTRAADWLEDQGVVRLDLGPVDSGPGGSLARFKLGSGAQPHRLGGTWLALGRGSGTGRAKNIGTPAPPC